MECTPPQNLNSQEQPPARHSQEQPPARHSQEQPPAPAQFRQAFQQLLKNQRRPAALGLRRRAQAVVRRPPHHGRVRGQVCGGAEGKIICRHLPLGSDAIVGSRRPRREPERWLKKRDGLPRRTASAAGRLAPRDG